MGRGAADRAGRLRAERRVPLRARGRRGARDRHGLAAWAVYAVFQANYGLYCVFLSAFVVLLLDVVKKTPSAAAIDRALDTTLGAILALLIFIATRPLDEGTATSGPD